MRVKVCGVTRVADALHACRAGVDAVGFNCYESSPRYVTLDAMREISDALPPFVTRVGLFVDHREEQVEAVAATGCVELLQFHGHETNDYCKGFRMPFVKVIRVSPETDVVTEAALYPDAAGILLDTYVEGLPGGTGETFDWQRVIGADIHQPLIVAGGLTAANVGAVIRTLRPYGVDVAGGVERARGEKDERMIRDFMKAVRAADEEARTSEAGSEA